MKPSATKKIPTSMQVYRQPIIPIITVTIETKPADICSAIPNTANAVVYLFKGKQSTIRLIAGGTKKPMNRPVPARKAKCVRKFQAKAVATIKADQSIIDKFMMYFL